MKKSEKQELYNRIMEATSQMVVKMLNEDAFDNINIADDDDIVLTHLEEDAVALYAFKYGRYIGNLSKNDDKNVAISDLEDILSQYPGNFQSDLSEYCKWANNGLMKLNESLKTISLSKSSIIDKEIERQIVHAFSIKYKLDEEKFNKMFTFLINGKKVTLNFNKLSKANKWILYNEVLCNPFVRKMLNFTKCLITIYYNTDCINDMIEKFAKTNDRSTFEGSYMQFIFDNTQSQITQDYQRVRNNVSNVFNYTVSDLKNNATSIEQIKNVDVFILMRIILGNLLKK